MRGWLMLPVETILDPGIVHLKSYLTYLGRGVMIAARPYPHHPILEGFRILVVPDEEAYAANTLSIGETVLMRPANYTVRILKILAIQKFKIFNAFHNQNP